ncbi:MAG: aldo/keto reductase [Candidatus Heimdallarchaeota archaeon]|nr:aldo/keto reductase [Candidatus Heimdallarchaeota archaeon]
MKTRTLGKTNLKASSIGMGCWAIGGPFYHSGGRIISYGQVKDDESIQALERGIELGVNLFDTANNYGGGRSETILGKVLKGRREEFIIATKFGTKWDFNSGDSKVPMRLIGRDHTPEGIRKACEKSLQNLQTNYIDFYQVHSGNMNSEEALVVVETLEELVDEGKIRYYGWSTDYPERGVLLAHGKHFAGMQFRLNLIHSNNKMLKLLDKHNIFGLIKNPLGGGLLTGKYKDDSKVPQDHNWYGTDFTEGKIGQVRLILDALREILENDGRTLVQASLDYILAKHERVIPIPGFKTIKQVEENIKAMELGPLSNKLVNQIDKLFAEVRQDQSEVNR